MISSLMTTPSTSPLGQRETRSVGFEPDGGGPGPGGGGGVIPPNNSPALNTTNNQEQGNDE